MTDLTAFTAYVKRTIIQLLVLSVVITVILAVGGWTSYILGWCVGSALNIVYFFMMTSRGLRALRLPPERAVYFIRGGAVLRLTMISLSLIVITQFPSIHLGACVAGIFSYRVVIIGTAIFARLRRVWRKEV